MKNKPEWVYIFIALTMVGICSIGLTISGWWNETETSNKITATEKRDNFESVTSSKEKKKREEVHKQIDKEANARIIYRPINLSVHRQELIREYARIHYGEPLETIVPQAVVLHWTAMDGVENVYRYFYNEESPDYSEPEYGLLNVVSHYLVDRDGTIYQLTPETMLNRHAIGLNWCSIGIENIGGVGDQEDLTDEQLEANLFLIKYLQSKYPTIHYVLGHYQQDQAKDFGLWREQIKGYYAKKSDPGSRFMQKISILLEGSEIVTFVP